MKKENMNDHSTIQRMYRDSLQRLKEEAVVEGSKCECLISDLEAKLTKLDSETDIIEHRKTAVELRKARQRLQEIRSKVTDFETQNSVRLMQFMKVECKPKRISNGLHQLNRRGIHVNEVSQRSNMYRLLRSQIDPTYTAKTEQNINDTNYCFECSEFRESTMDDSCLVCQTCGSERMVAEKYIRSSGSDAQTTKTKSFEYQRLLHFCNWLDNIQGLSTANIPPEVYARVIKEIKRERRMDKLNTLDESDIRRYLKKYRCEGMDKFYDNCTQILYFITEKEPLRFSTQQRHNLVTLFKAIQEPFELFKPQDKHNFSSYSSIIYRFCQLLGYDEFLPKLRLHKNEATRAEHERIWKKICRFMGGEEYGWKYMKIMTEAPGKLS
jgi:DNA-directed RNA polymerase subunit RPC12/RpoP